MNFVLAAVIYLATYRFAVKLLAEIHFSSWIYKIGGSTALVILMLKWNLFYEMSKEECKVSTNFIVKIDDKIGAFDPLGEPGTLEMIYQNTSKKAIPNAEGKAVFENVKPGKKVKFVFYHSEPFYVVYADSLYTVTSEEEALVEIKLKFIDRVAGRVLANDQVVKGAIITLDHTQQLVDTTDELGRFELHIPDTLQRNTYKLFCSAPDYFPAKLDYSPQTGREAEVLLQSK